MFSAVLFAQDRVGSKTIEWAAMESREVCIYKTMHAFPTPYELTRLLEIFKPDIVFVELSPLERALALVRTIRMIAGEAAIIGYLWQAPEQQLERAFQAGVLQILPSPLTLADLQHAVEQAMRKARPQVQDNLLTFLPAKAGSGATTVAVNVAGRLANGVGQKVLVIDADLHSGLVSVLLKVQAEHTVVHALENAALLDGTLWSRIVAHVHRLDLLVTPKPNRAPLVSWTQYHQLLQFVRPRYQTIVVDLPEVINDATVEIVRRARRVFIVTTPELPPLVLARQRCLTLAKQGIPEDRIGIIVNRWDKDEIEVPDIERFLEKPVSAVFQSDYQCVRRATHDGRLIGRRSALGKAFAAFAETLTDAGDLAGREKSTLSFLGTLRSR